MNSFKTGLLIKLAGVMLIVAGLNLTAGEKVVEESFDLNQGGVLRVHVESASVNIRPGSGDKVVMVAKVPDRFEFKYDSQSNNLLIEGEYEPKRRWGFWGRDSGEIELTIPAECELEIKTSGGAIKAEGITGTSHLFNTSGGSVKLASINGNLDVATSGGKIKVSNSNGRKNLRTSGGGIHVGRGEGSVRAATSGGGIELEGVNGEVEAKTSGGGITIYLDGDNEGIVAKTSGGSIKVYGPQDLKADLDAKTSGGSVYCNYGVTQRGKMDNNKVRGTVNGGGPLIKLNTSGGSIKIGPR